MEGAQRVVGNNTAFTFTNNTDLKVVLCVLSWKSSTALSTQNRAPEVQPCIGVKVKMKIIQFTIPQAIGTIKQWFCLSYSIQ